jgi:hypothetical protein
MENTNRPNSEYKTGGISASVWKNTQTDKYGKSFPSTSVTIAKRYKVGQEWKKGSSFKLDEVPKLIVLLQELCREQLISNGKTEFTET